MIFFKHNLVVDSTKEAVAKRLQSCIRRHIPKGYVANDKFCLYLNLGASYNRTIKLFVVYGTFVDISGSVQVNNRVLPTIFVAGIQVGLIVALVSATILLYLNKVSSQMTLFCLAICLIYLFVVVGQGIACKEYFERRLCQQ